MDNHVDESEFEIQRARLEFIKEHRREPTYYELFGHPDWKKQLKLHHETLEREERNAKRR